MITLRNFFERAREGTLTGVRCRHCGALAIPPKESCATCHQRGWEAVPLSGEGTIETFTVIRVGEQELAAETPHAVAMVRLKEGVALLGRIVDMPVDAVAVGLPVRFRPLVSHDQTSVAFGPA